MQYVQRGALSRNINNHAVCLQIVTVTTDDDLSGQPWPPTSDTNILWSLVRRAEGRALWRSIQLVQSDPPPADAQCY
jgi:hypothetical protein